MTLASIAWRYLWSRPLVTLLTLAGVVLGSALICAVLTLRRESEKTFLAEAGLFDIVVGAKGSPLQLVLSSIYHLDIPTGNIAYTEYEAIAKDRQVRAAIPIGLGDNYRGYRIVGTTPEFFKLQKRGLGSQAPVDLFSIAEGTLFQKDFEAVLGSEVARLSGMGIGGTFAGAHGLVAVAGSAVHNEFPYRVVGVLASTGTSADRAVYTTLASVWKVHDSEEASHAALFSEPEMDDEPVDENFAFFAQAAEKQRVREVTAVLVQLHTAGRRLWFADEINTGTNAMAAIPINEMLRLYRQILAPMQRTLLAVAYLVVVVASLSILATLYQSAERRRRDIAILRALGARRFEVFALVLLESKLLAILGVAGGWLVGHGAIALMAQELRERTGLSIAPWTIDQSELLALGIVLAVGIVAGVVPAVLAYRREPLRDLGSI